jgi:hypothetical protein
MHTYTVVVLGSSGAGKTVYLSSLFEKLSIQDETIGFFLESTWEDRQLLTKLFNQIANPNLEWPAGTLAKDTRTFEFICSINKQSENNDYAIYQAVKFLYLDYAGGFITDDTGGHLAENLKQAVNNADSLMGIIDGQKVYAAMKGLTTKFKTSIYQDIDNILVILQRSRNPVQLILTKWDILHNNGITLKEVRDWLMLYRNFANFVRARDRQKYPMRLIPVSSVGYKFSKLDESGIVTKQANTHPEPFNVEMPLACVLLDKFAVHVQELIEKKNKEVGDPIEASVKYTVAGRLSKLFGGVVRVAIELLPLKFRFSEGVFQNVLDWIEKSARKDERAFQKELNALVLQKQNSLNLVDDEISAVNYVVHCFQFLMTTLDKEFPESNLSRL